MIIAENRYDSLIQFYSEQKGLNWLKVKAQMKAESWDPKKKDWNPDAISTVGAVGLPQFMRATWEEWKDGTPGIQITKMIFSRNNPEHSIRAMCAYLKWLYKWVGNNIHYTKNHMDEAVWASYNWGIGNVRDSVHESRCFDSSRFPVETKGYLTRIENYFKEYTVSNAA